MKNGKVLIEYNCLPIRSGDSALALERPAEQLGLELGLLEQEPHLVLGDLLGEQPVDVGRQRPAGRHGPDDSLVELEPCELPHERQLVCDDFLAQQRPLLEH